MGGLAKVKKGFATLSKKKRSAISRAAIAKRWEKKQGTDDVQRKR